MFRYIHKYEVRRAGDESRTAIASDYHQLLKHREMSRGVQYQIAFLSLSLVCRIMHRLGSRFRNK
jgi:adenylate kinase